MLKRCQSRPFSGGLPLRPFKALSTGVPIAIAPMPRELVIAMAQHAGPAATPVVEAGQRVERGQPVGTANEPGSVAVHCAAAGTVRSIEERWVPTGSRLRPATCVIVATDAASQVNAAAVAAQHWPGDRAARLEAIRCAGIVGLGGATFPTHLKLAARSTCDTLILNGAECEPYISCDDMLMRERASSILEGARLMLELLGAHRCIVAIERDKVAAVEAVERALETQSDERFCLAVIPTVYPAGGEKQLVESLLGLEVPSGGLPIDLGVVCQNVGTADALARYARDARPVLSRIVTITGHGLIHPQNVEAPIGMPIRELIEYCGGLRADAYQLIVGGNMMGYALPNDAIPVTKATNCVIALAKHEAWAPGDEWPCIRCDDCARACPARLQPQELLRATRAGDHRRLGAFAVDECIECGCCDVVCPSHIPLTSIMRDGKRALASYVAREARAGVADRLYAEHVHRAQREADDARREQAKLTAVVTGDDEARRAAITAAITRSEARRRSDKDPTR